MTHAPPLAATRPEETQLVTRGVRRALSALGFASVTEVRLPDGRRADVLGVNDAGELWIVEVKSSLADFTADDKWPGYRAFCDRLCFAVGPAFPRELLPADCGVFVADGFGAIMIRPAPLHPLAAARRKRMLIVLASTAARRLHLLADPNLGEQDIG